MKLTKIQKATNQLIDFLNKENVSEEEIIVILSQLLIQIGKSIYDPNNKLGKELNWQELNQEYYANKNPSIGLGLMLNGGSMLQAVDQSKLIDAKEI